MDLAEALDVVYGLACRAAVDLDETEESASKFVQFGREQEALKTVNLYRLHLTQPVDQK